MERAKELSSGQIIHADNAIKGKHYVCPRPGCGGRVYLPDVRDQTPHFRHYPYEGTKECEDYHPGSWSGATAPPSVVDAIEDDTAELGLLLVQVDDLWTLGVRLPEIPNSQLGAGTLRDLGNAFVDVTVGPDCTVRTSALDLRPGIGVARVDIVPSAHPVCSQAIGIWPASIDRRLWQLECKGFHSSGALFRLRRGEWTRLVENSGVHAGETLLLLAQTRCPPPTCVASTKHSELAGDSSTWAVWEVTLSSDADASELAWLSKLNHRLIPCSWSIELVTPPRNFGEQGQPIFWMGDTAVLAVRAPGEATSAPVTLKYDTNCFSGTVSTKDGTAYVALQLQSLGLTRFAISSEKAASLEVLVVFRPSLSKLSSLLTQTPRLRVWVGDTALEAWRTCVHEFALTRAHPPSIRVQLELEGVRTQVRAWQAGKQRLSSGLDELGTTKIVQELLLTASRIEIDAGNLGRITLLPRTAASRRPQTHAKLGRLDLYAQTLALEGRAHNALPSRHLVGRPAVRATHNAALVLTRLAQRRRRATGEDRS